MKPMYTYVHGMTCVHVLLHVHVDCYVYICMGMPMHMHVNTRPYACTGRRGTTSIAYVTSTVRLNTRDARACLISVQRRPALPAEPLSAAPQLSCGLLWRFGSLATGSTPPPTTAPRDSCTVPHATYSSTRSGGTRGDRETRVVSNRGLLSAEARGDVAAVPL